MVVVGDGMEEGSERETRINKIDGMIARCQRSANSNSFSIFSAISTIFLLNSYLTPEMTLHPNKCSHSLHLDTGY